MDDLISRQAAMDIASGYCGYCHPANIAKELAKLPSAQPEHRTGKWIPMFEGRSKAGAYWFMCSNCQHVAPGGLQSCKFYCETCGADMRGEADE